jgi:VWFA-related protein
LTKIALNTYWKCRAMMKLIWAAVTFTTLIAAQDPPRYTETVNVGRVLIDARAIDSLGRPLLGLTEANFQVRIDGKAARVESVQWVTGVLADREIDPLMRPESAGRPVAGRLVVFLFQKSMERGRITGFMRMLLNLRNFLDGFTPHDRLAILSFDSRLRLWLDFTSDMDRVRQVLSKNLLFGGPAPASALQFPSLFDTVERQQLDRTYTLENALLLIANALEPLPGAKILVLVGHGLGRGPEMVVESNYGEVRAALHRARASVFTLDVTEADYHTLEAGLQLVAEDTGGFYERTHIFGRRALERLAAAISGHYVLIVEKPDVRSGTHRIEVKLHGRGGTVLARNAYID